jgi:hypothetical protein
MILDEFNAEAESLFLERFPRCEEFRQIFHFLRSLEIGHDTAASSSIDLMKLERVRPTESNGQFTSKITAEDFLSLFSDKAGASLQGLISEAKAQLGISQATFFRHLKAQHEHGAIIKLASGLWKLATSK